jgi:uncharacterized protein (TIGR03382 family)
VVGTHRIIIVIFEVLEMNKVFGLIALAGIAAAANAQAGVYTWQVSADNGATWSSLVSGSSGSTVKVRLLASWSGVALGTGGVDGDIGYGGGQFDGKVTNGGGDTFAAITRPDPFAFAVQSLVSSTIGADAKLDTAADTSGFGAGTGWVGPGQQNRTNAGPAYNNTNGAVVFSYSITLGASSSDRIVGMVLNSAAGRAMSIYTNAAGTQVRISATAVTVNNATISVPTPGSMALLGLGGLVAGRRRR